MMINCDMTKKSSINQRFLLDISMNCDQSMILQPISAVSIIL